MSDQPLRILVLDDNEIVRTAPESYFVDPHDYRDDEFTQTRNVRKFVEHFFKGEWDLVWIDHDLGTGKINGRTATKDIYDYILGSGRKMKSTPEIWITTMNPAVADNMVSDLVACKLNVKVFPISALRDYGISRGDIINY